MQKVTNLSPVFHDPVYLGIGGNLLLAGFESVKAGCLAGLGRLAELPEIRLVAVSPWYSTAPVLRDANSRQAQHAQQNWYSNAVAHISTRLTPEALLAAIHRVEGEFGRVRGPDTQDAPRGLDMDIIDFAGLVREIPPPILPHPRMAGRGFVLAPLADLNPHWRHPITGRGVSDLLAEVSPAQKYQRA